MDINFKILRPKIREYLDEFYVYKNSNANSNTDLFSSVKYMDIYFTILQDCIDKVKLERQIEIYNKHKKNLKNVSNNVANTNGSLKDKCVGFKVDAKNHLGGGKFGEVYKISPTVVVKLSDLFIFTSESNDRRGDSDAPYCRDNLKECLESEYELSKKAAKLGVSPKVYDTYICKVSENEFYNVTFMENVEGVTYKDWLATEPSTKDKKLVYNIILKKIKKLQDNNIMHSDIHGGNMIVTKKNGKFDVVILDYGKAKTAGILTNRQHWMEQGWLNDFSVEADINPVIKYEEHQYVIYKLVKNNYLKVKM